MEVKEREREEDWDGDLYVGNGRMDRDKVISRILRPATIARGSARENDIVRARARAHARGYQRFVTRPSFFKHVWNFDKSEGL